MKRRILSLLIYLLLGSISGAFAFTASEYVDCEDLFPDEFLDLAFESPNPVSPIFESQPYIHPTLLHFLKELYFQEIFFLTACLRC